MGSPGDRHLRFRQWGKTQPRMARIERKERKAALGRRQNRRLSVRSANEPFRCGYGYSCHSWLHLASTVQITKPAHFHGALERKNSTRNLYLRAVTCSKYPVTRNGRRLSVVQAGPVMLSSPPGDFPGFFHKGTNNLTYLFPDANNLFRLLVTGTILLEANRGVLSGMRCRNSRGI